MKYIGGIITSYIVLLVLDIMQRRNHKRTQSLKKFTVRTITDVSIVCAVGAIFVIGAMVFALIDEPEVFKKNTFIMLILVAFLGLMFFGMIAPIKGVWGAINFNNMIPIHSDQLEHIDIRILPTDDKATVDYKNLLANQLSWCNTSANAASIIQKAEKL